MKKVNRQEQKEHTHRHLIEVAFQQLAEHGLIATRTADIAKAAKVSHGTIFVHFPTKEELLTAVIEEFGARIALRLHELAANGGGVRQVLEAYLEGLTEYEPFYSRLVMEGHLLPERSRNTLVMIQSALSFHLCQALERETAEGKIRPFPTHLLFNTWIGLIHYYLTNRDLFAPGESILKRYGTDLLNYFLNLLAKEE
ncbi:MAG TPA: TetR/AcrR family transcriptional regulator [Bacillota bacterium]